MNEDIQNERERLRIRREKDLHNGLVDQLRREPAEDNWDLADSVFTPDELADWSARIRGAGFWFKLDTAAFWLSILFLNGVRPSDPLAADPEAIEVLFIGLIFISFFAWFVLFFRSRSLKQDFTREFALRVERKRKAGNGNAVPERETIGFRRESGTQKETTP